MKVRQRKDGTSILILTETEIRRQIRAWLKMQGITFWHNAQSVLSFKGLPDLEGIVDKHHFYIEIKCAKGKLSERQVAFKTMVELEHEKVFVVHSLDELIDQWKQWCKSL